MSELGFVAGGDDLEFSDGVLIELRGRAAAELVLVGLTINKETGVVGALAENWSGVVAVEVGLPVDGHARNQLHEIQVVPSIEGHVHDLAGKNCGALRGGGCLKEGNF